METLNINHNCEISKQILEKLVPKVWGQEIHLVTEEEYTVKIMELKPGHKCSFHLHKNKKESFILLKGNLTLNFTNSKNAELISVSLKEKFDTITLEPMTIHSFSCDEETLFIECSTKDEASDSYRFTKSS